MKRRPQKHGPPALSTPKVIPMLQDFPEENIEPLATGAWILGTGGGGNPYISTLNLRRLYAEGRRVQVMDPMALEDDDMVAVVSKMGAPLVGQERLSDPVHLARAVEVMEDYLGKPFRAIMSVEIGGSNALSSFLAAAMLDRPVVNADAMGRAYPEAQMTSFAIGNLPMFPLSLVDIRDNEVIVTRAASWKWMERISRKVCTEVGSTAATCKAPRTGREVKDWGIHYTVTKATELGRVVIDARARHDDPVRAVLDHEGGKQLFRGKVIDVVRERPAASCAARPSSKALMLIAVRASNLPSRTNGPSPSAMASRLP